MFLSCLMQKAKKEWTIGIHLLHRIRIQMTVTYVPLALKIIYTNIILSGSHLFSCTVESLIKVPWVPPSLNEFRGKCFSYYSSSSMVPPTKTYSHKRLKKSAKSLENTLFRQNIRHRLMDWFWDHLPHLGMK